MVDLRTLIETHGYWVLVAGCLLEGETILILAGFAVHRGYLNPYAVVAIAVVAGFLGDQCFFWLGRWRGPAMIARWPSIARKSDRVRNLMIRFDAALIVGVRFAYGLRIAGPVLMGMSSIAGQRFALFNALGATLWACLFAGLGWAFGQMAVMLLGQIRHLEGWILVGLALAGLVVWLMRNRRDN